MGGSEGMEKMPEALAKLGHVVSLENGETILVQKWSATKFFLIVDHVASLFKELPEAEIGQLSGSGKELVPLIAKLLGNKIMGFVKFSVREEDAKKLDNATAEEIVDILTIVIELNLTEKFVKKLQGLGTRLKSVFTASDKNTQ